MKCKKILVIGVVILCISLLIGIILAQQNKKIYIYSCISYAWGKVDEGFIIYNNGIIKEYDKINKNRELKKSKISNEELRNLKELANKVENEFIIDDKWKAYDAGTSTKEIYNSKKKEWIPLEEFGYSRGKNYCEGTQEIIELIDELKEKYF